MLAHSTWAKVEDVSLRYARSDGPTPATSVERGDIQAGQRIATGAAEVQEVVFSDGTVLVLGPNSDAVIENLESSDSGLQRLALRLNQGLVRITGGASNAQRPILLATPSAELALSAASAVIEVSPNGDTRASLLSGRELAMTSGGQTERILRPGYELSSLRTGGAPAGPAQQAEGVAGSDALALGTAQLTRQAGSSEEAVAGATPGNIATENVRVAAVLNDAIQGSAGASLAPGSAQFVEIAALPGGAGSDGFGPGLVLGAPQLVADQPSRIQDQRRTGTQNREPPEVDATDDLTRAPGPTANRLFNSPTPFSQALGTNNPSIVVDKSLWFADSIANRLQYVFSNESQLVLDALGDERRTTWYKTTQVGGSGNFNSPFIIPRISTLFGADGVVGEGSDVGQYKAGVLQSQTPGSVFGPFTYRSCRPGLPETIPTM